MNVEEMLGEAKARKLEILKLANIDPSAGQDFLAMAELVGEMLGLKAATFYKKSKGNASGLVISAMLIDSVEKLIRGEAEKAFKRAIDV